jgi:hypothetical protein
MGVSFFEDNVRTRSCTIGLGCSANCTRWCRTLSGNRFLRLRRYLVELPWLQIDGVAYERVAFKGKNGKQAIQLWGAQAECHIHGIVPIEIDPWTWKKALGLPAMASKPLYIEHVNSLTGLALTDKDEDQAAAIGIGLAVFGKP